MAYFAVLDQDNIIVNLIIADSLQIAESVSQESVSGATCIEYTLPIIGGTYSNGVFVDPELPVITEE